MNNIQIFNNPILGDLRTVIVNGKEYFFGVDIASMLMYKRPRKAVSDNCKGVLVEDSFKIMVDMQNLLFRKEIFTD